MEPQIAFTCSAPALEFAHNSASTLVAAEK